MKYNYTKMFGLKYGRELKRIHEIQNKNKSYRHHSEWTENMKFIQSFSLTNDNMDSQRSHSPVFTIEQVEFLLEEYKKHLNKKNE